MEEPPMEWDDEESDAGSQAVEVDERGRKKKDGDNDDEGAEGKVSMRPVCRPMSLLW